jgi:cysteine-rich repeat protein
VDPGEDCDDANTFPGDGCSADCRSELFEREGPEPVCGDAALDPGEQCDDGNVREQDGCSPRCLLEPGYRCDGAGACSPATCGDGIQEGFEACDDGNANVGDGCSSDCLREPVCTAGSCETTCGDGWVDGSEPCDDGNLLAGDGCDVACSVEAGYFCEKVIPASEPEWGDWAGVADVLRSSCIGLCGDGIVVSGEQCDDGVNNGSSGCLTTCLLAN